MKKARTSTCLAIGEARIGALPMMITALNMRSCFVLVLHDPLAGIAGMTHLRLPANTHLAHYVKLAFQRLQADMHGAGAPRTRITAHVAVERGVPSSLLRTIAGMIRAQGISGVHQHSLEPGLKEIRFHVREGKLEVEGSPHAERVPDTRAIALDLGSQILDLHSLRQDVDTARPALPLWRMLTQIVYSASRMLGDAQSFVALLEDDHLVVKAASHPAGDVSGHRDALQRDPLADWLFARRRATQLECGQAEGAPLPDRARMVSIVSQPLYAQADQIGVLYAIRPTENAFCRDDAGILALLAQQASIAIGNARIYQKLLAKTCETESILQSIDDGLVVVDPQMRLVIANLAARSLLGVAPSIQAGALLPPESPLAGLVEAAKVQGSMIHEIALENPSRETIICQATVSQVLDPLGHVQGIVAVLRDVTQERQLEQLRSNLMSVVSHELRTPLHSINGFVDLILMGKTGRINELQRDFLTTVKQQSAQLQHIIDDVLEFSRLEYGQDKLTTEPVHVHQLASRVFRKLALLADESQIEMICYIDEGLPVIPGDSVRLEQVLSNLVDNALKFTPSGGQIIVGAKDTGDAIKLWVSDTGVGIPEEEQPRIFEKFYQVASGINTPGPRRGAGLGLTICKHIVEQHQGDIWVESVAGGGSTFYVSLPKHRREDGSPSERLPGERVSASKDKAPIPLPHRLRSTFFPRERIKAHEIASPAPVGTPGE